MLHIPFFTVRLSLDLEAVYPTLPDTFYFSASPNEDVTMARLSWGIFLLQKDQH